MLEVDSDNIREKINEISGSDFIKVSGEATFNDMKLIVQTMNSFNKVGEAITYLSTFQELQEEKIELEEKVEQTKDRNQRAVFKQKLKNAMNIKNLAKESGLNLDEKLLEKLAFMLDYGYKDQFELQIPIKIENEELDERVIFSAVLKRELLKDREDILIKRYARISEKKFTLFGIVTQSEKEVSVLDSDEPIPEGEVNSETESSHLKQVLMRLHAGLSGVEDNFIGRLPNEVIIDPIAIYRDL